MEYLSQEIYRSSGKKSELTYSGLAEIVQTSDSMEFLKGINCSGSKYQYFLGNFPNHSCFYLLFFLEMVPRKITYKEYLDLMKKEKDTEDLF